MALLSAACQKAPPPAARPTYITISVPYQVDTLDPHARDLVGQYALGAHFYEPLVAKNADLEIEPRLAVRWLNHDPLTWVFHLRPGVRFHDGAPFDSADVVETFARLAHDPRLEVGLYVAQVDSVTATDPLTVEIRTRRPASGLLNQISRILVIPRGKTFENLAQRPNGTGPFRFLHWEPGVRIDLARHDAYWGPPPALARVSFLLDRGPDPALQDLVTGRSGLAQLGGRESERTLVTHPALRSLHRTGIFLKYLGYDLARDETPYVHGSRNPFRMRAVRQAMSLAIDRVRLVAALPTFATPASQIVPPSIFGFDPSLPDLRHDPGAARALLREAGFPQGFAATLHARRLVGAAGGALREMLGAVGIRIEVQDLDEPAFFKTVAERPSLFLTRYGCDTGDAADVLHAAIHTVDTRGHYGTANFGRYSNDSVDRDIEQSDEVLDPGGRRSRLQAVMRRVMDDLAVIPLYFDEDAYGLGAGFTWHPRADSYILAEEIGVAVPP